MKIDDLVKDMALAVISLLLVVPILIYGFPLLVGADSSYMVMSGSMNPALLPGDLVIVERVDPSLIQAGDVVTVESHVVFTHRVVEVRLEEGAYLFRTKGDANEDPDPKLIQASQIIGKVILVFPFSHVYTPYGFISLVITPTVLIIAKQMYRVHEVTKSRNRKELLKWRRESRNSSTFDASTLLLSLILVASTTRIMAPHIQSGSISYFSDTETVWGFFSAGYWIIQAEVDIKPDTLNLGSQGEWITVYAVIETEYDENDIIIESVMLEDVIPAIWDEVNGTQLMVKFDRGQVIDYLQGYQEGEEVILTVSGEFRDGVRFTGKDTIKVVDNEG